MSINLTVAVHFMPSVQPYLKVGDQFLTLQANIPMGQQIDSVKPGVISLAKALVAKVR